MGGQQPAPRSLFARPSALPLALALYLVMVFSVRGMGVVGEVALAWTWGPPPAVALDLASDPILWSGPDGQPHAGHRMGPLRASQTRPLERLQLGGAWMPLAVNSYTGGLADWPARLVHGVTRSAGAVVLLHALSGAGLLVLIAWLLRRAGLREAPGVALLVLATDWSFAFFRRVLGGTELLLLLAGLLLMAGLWAWRRQGRRSDVLIAVALGLGMLAKATFLPTAVAFFLATWLTRGDGPPLQPPRLRWGRIAGIALLICAPLWIALLHRLALPDDPRLYSHDGLAMQGARLSHGLKGLLGGGGASAAREMPASLGYFFFEPLRWFEPALGAREVSWGWAVARLVGWGSALAGAALAWRGRRSEPPGTDPHGALLRWLSVAAPLQIGLLWLANRDLHHLAQATPTVALLVGLGCERVAARFTQPGGVHRHALAIGLALPLMVAGFASGVRTGRVIDTVPAPAITERGQRALERLVEEHAVQRLWTSDYDLYGVFELRRPQLELAHAWGAVSLERRAALPDLLRAAQGAHYLAVKPAAPRIYDLAPSDADVQRAAREAGVEAVLVGQIEGRGWARLYRVEER
jgi:hypothetical protein